MNKNIRTPENGIEAVDFAIRTEKLQKDLNDHKGNVDYCSEIINTLNEEEAKAILKHTFYKN